MTKTTYCVDCGVEFTPDHHNRLDGLEGQLFMCDSCMVEDAKEDE